MVEISRQNVSKIKNNIYHLFLLDHSFSETMDEQFLFDVLRVPCLTEIIILICFPHPINPVNNSLSELQQKIKLKCGLSVRESVDLED